MKVKELIEKLKSFDDELEVILSRDPKGNGYAPLYHVWDANYKVEDGHCEVGLYELTEEDILEGYTEEDLLSDGTRAVILTPREELR